MEAWNRLCDIFQGNKHSRAVTLEYDFSHVDMADFSNVSTYCQHLKSLSDQLKNSPVDNNRLIFQLVSGLTEPYKGVATFIRQSDPLPQFYQARSTLTLEEAGLAKKAAHSSSSAMVTCYSNGPHDISDHASSNCNNNGGKRNQNCSYNGGKNRSNIGGHGSEKGGISGGGNAGDDPIGSGNNRGIGQQPAGRHSPTNVPWYGRQPWPWKAPWTPWPIPPCPYPSNAWTRPTYGQQHQPHQGILRTRPQQAYTIDPTPTNIEAVMHTLGITPLDANWYMDTGATSHMTSAQGNLMSYFNLSNKHGIIVGNGQSIPIHDYGHTKLSSPCPPLQLHNVLHVPHLVKNLVSIKKSTTDNSISVEFDPFGFYVEDLQTGRQGRNDLKDGKEACESERNTIN
ncbi:hypothetical protein AAHE18_01G107500 [Arachis hypogaea]